MTTLVRELLGKAADTVDQRGKERDTQNGAQQERSMAATVKAFNAVYGTSLTESQGWGFMVLLKQVRASRTGYHEDDFLDGAAYTALQAEAKKAEAEQGELVTWTYVP